MRRRGPGPDSGRVREHGELAACAGEHQLLDLKAYVRLERHCGPARHDARRGRQRCAVRQDAAPIRDHRVHLLHRVRRVGQCDVLRHLGEQRRDAERLAEAVPVLRGHHLPQVQDDGNLVQRIVNLSDHECFRINCRAERRLKRLVVEEPLSDRVLHGPVVLRDRLQQRHVAFAVHVLLQMRVAAERRQREMPESLVEVVDPRVDRPKHLHLLRRQRHQLPLVIRQLRLAPVVLPELPSWDSVAYLLLRSDRPTHATDGRQPALLQHAQRRVATLENLVRPLQVGEVTDLRLRHQLDRPGRREALDRVDELTRRLVLRIVDALAVLGVESEPD